MTVRIGAAASLQAARTLRAIRRAGSANILFAVFCSWDHDQF